MRILTIVLFSCLYSLSSFASVRTWVAASSYNKIITSYEVKKFSMALELSDDAMITLFKRANNDFNKYHEEVEKWLKPRFSKNLKVMIYSSIIKEKAIREYKNKEFFNITKLAYTSAIQEIENRVLGTFLDKGEGIAKARNTYGQFLIDNNFPHPANESKTDIYMRWFKLQKARIKIEMLLVEVKKYESAMAMKGSNHLSSAGTMGLKIYDYYQDTKEVSDNINNKYMSLKDLSQYLKEHESIAILAEKIKHYSLLSSNYGELKNKRPEINNIQESFIQDLNSTSFSNKVQAYIEKASVLKNKYNSNEELENKKVQAIQSFMRTGENKFMMLAHLYTLAIDFDSNKSNIINNAVKQIELKLNHASNQLTFIKSIEQALYKTSKKENKLQQMIHFMMSFEAKKLAYADTGLVTINLRDYKSSETYNLIKSAVYNNAYKNGLKEFRNKLKNNYIGILNINLNGDKNLSKEQALEFVF